MATNWDGKAGLATHLLPDLTHLSSLIVHLLVAINSFCHYPGFFLKFLDRLEHCERAVSCSRLANKSN